MKELGNTIYLWGCVVAATILGVGIADYWFADHQFSAFFSWAVLAAIPWIIGRASLYGLSRIRPGDNLPVQYRNRAGE
jgi:Mg2+/citrate symporter